MLYASITSSRRAIAFVHTDASAERAELTRMSGLTEI
jgi:hypothetical protein